jgi:acyl carrier protein
VRCFSAVFPSVPAGKVGEISVANTSQWDSLASATLLSVIEQEFGVSINPMDAPDLDSFDSIRNYLDGLPGQ